MPPKKRPAAGPLEEPRPKVAKEESLLEKQLRLALDRLEIAQNGLKTAKTKKEVEAAKKEVEAAENKVEAAKKEVEAGPAQELPTPSSTTKVKLPKLGKFKDNALLEVKEFQDFVAPNTTTERPLFLRKHLLNVHEKAVKALQLEEIRLVSLVGCPGTGKTWCGWLVAYTLQKACKKTCKKTLHLTIRNSTVTTIANFQVKKQYEEVQWNGHMLKQVLRESECEVCIVDVSMDKPDAALDIFIGIRQLIEDGKFAGVKFMGLLSGHGQKTITGKQSNILEVTQKLVLWSWTEREVAGLGAKMEQQGLKPPLEDAYAVCGGSVRHLFQPHKDEKQIRDAVLGLTQADMAKLLALDLGVDDVDKKHRTGLLSFFPSRGSKAVDESFAEGVSEARPMPRSDFVIKCIKENEHAEFGEVAKMYRRLSGINPGAAGTAFELLVHLFWREAAANKHKVELSLVSVEGKEISKVEVDCQHFEEKPKSIEEYEEEAVEVGNDTVGYFTPDSPQYRVLDSILRFKSADKTEVLAIQISTAVQHKHGPLEPLPKLLPPLPTKPQLALWDFPPDKRCNWNPGESEHWELLHVGCNTFNERMRGR